MRSLFILLFFAVATPESSQNAGRASDPRVAAQIARLCTEPFYRSPVRKCRGYVRLVNGRTYRLNALFPDGSLELQRRSGYGLRALRPLHSYDRIAEVAETGTPEGDRLKHQLEEQG